MGSTDEPFHGFPDEGEPDAQQQGAHERLGRRNRRGASHSRSGSRSRPYDARARSNDSLQIENKILPNPKYRKRPVNSTFSR